MIDVVVAFFLSRQAEKGQHWPGEGQHRATPQFASVSTLEKQSA